MDSTKHLARKMAALYSYTYASPHVPDQLDPTPNPLSGHPHNFEGIELRLSFEIPYIQTGLQDHSGTLPLYLIYLMIE